VFHVDGMWMSISGKGVSLMLMSTRGEGVSLMWISGGELKTLIALWTS